MRILLLAGTSLLALASPALAQQNAPERTGRIGQPDLLEPADDQPAQQALKPTGDAIVDRLNALEARSNSSKPRMRNSSSSPSSIRPSRTVETRAARNVQVRLGANDRGSERRFHLQATGRDRGRRRPLQRTRGRLLVQRRHSASSHPASASRVRPSSGGTTAPKSTSRDAVNITRRLSAIYEDPEDGADDRPVQGAVGLESTTAT